MTARDKAKIAYDALADKKANDIKVLDISKLSVISDVFVVASGSNKSQVDAMKANVEEFMRKAGHNMKNAEGHAAGGWILLDYYDIIVHIFSDEARKFYDIERTWFDGENITETIRG